MLADHDIGTVIFQFDFTYLTAHYIVLMILHKTKYFGGFPHSYFFIYIYANNLF
jgi:hypothetical protein